MTSANASFPATRSSTGSLRHAGSTRKNVYATYCPSIARMLVRVGDQRPAEGLVRDRRLAALVRAGAHVVHRALHKRAAGLRRPVRVVDPGLPAVVIRLVGHVEDQKPADRRLA